MTTVHIHGTNKTIGGEDVFVIAEIGKGFIQTQEERSVEEYLENAKRLVDAAVFSGADAVKFQTHELEDEFLPVDVTSPHFTAKGSDRYTWIGRNTAATPLESFWKPLKRYCEEKSILFFSTPMSRKAAMKLNEVGVPLWKVGSGDVQDNVLLEYITRDKKPVIVSTGMVSLAELDEVIRYIQGKGSPVIVLYCISEYPAPPEYFNLGTILYLKEKYPEVIVGFSDHSLGADIPLAAVKLGARVVEKHFSLDRALWGSDHKVSMLPQEMKEMIAAIRSGAYKEVNEKPYYGEKDKELQGARNQFRPYFNKALMAGDDVPEGTVLSKDMIFAMRPVMLAGGLPSQKFEEVVGKKTRAALKKYDPITKEVLHS